MRMRTAGLVALVLVALSSAATAADAVYRCGPEGREYSRSPCPGGQAVSVDDARTEQQRQQAQDAAKRDAKLGKQMTQERLAQEAAASRQGAASISPQPHAAASAPTHPHKKKHAHHKTNPTSDAGLTPPARVPAEPKAAKKTPSPG